MTTAKTKILLLAANPSENCRTRLDEEKREIEEGLKRSKHRDAYELISKGAVRQTDMMRAMLDHKPHIVHFCGGEASHDGIALQDNQGNPQIIPITGLSALFKLFSDKIECVVLNACYSEQQAHAIAEHIPYVIGMNDKIGDKAAILFAVAFYDAISAGNTLEFAYNLGKTAILMNGIDEHLIPILIANTQDAPKPSSAPITQPKPITQTPQLITTDSNNNHTLWLSFHLTHSKNTITASWKEHQQNTASQQLLPFQESETALETLAAVLLGDSDNWQQQLQPELQKAGLNQLQDVNLRIRVMTDDPQLAMLPWHKIKLTNNPRLIVETAPVITHYQTGFQSQTINNPLLAIPADPEHGIRGDTHYRLIQEHLLSHLNISGTPPRVRTTTQLKREIDYLQPDLIYLYAKYEHGQIQLDPDFINGEAITLDTLGDWINEADIRPIVILSLTGNETFNYSSKLVNNTRLLWVQHATREYRIDDLANNIINILKSLKNTPDIASSIINSAENPKYILEHYLWLNASQSIQIDSVNANDTSKQLRAALLKVMLGRDSQKKDVVEEVYNSNNIKDKISLTYVVTGNEMSCPFDFPAQLQQRLQWHDLKHSLDVIPFYLHISIEEHLEASRTMDLALGQGVRQGNQYIDSIFREEKKSRGLEGEDCCISINWLITVTHDQHDRIQEWLKAWVKIIHDDFHPINIPEKTVLVNAACLQITDNVNYQNIQNEARKTIKNTIKTLGKGNMQNIRIRDALGKLEAEEIEDFLEDKDWQQTLKLDQDKIDLEDYAEWIYQQKQGEFDDTVRLIWQQSQQGYEQYMNNMDVG